MKCIKGVARPEWILPRSTPEMTGRAAAARDVVAFCILVR